MNCRNILLSIVALLCGVGLLAQESTVKGNLGGTVFDSSGAVVAGAKVTLVGPTGTSTITTDSEGRFAFNRLTPGSYSVKAEAKGFKATQIKAAEVLTNRTSSLRLTLEPGGSTEVVEVSAETAGIDENATKMETNLNDTFYQNIPTARNVTGLFYASAGVTDGGLTGSANPSVAGGSGLENQYVADGVNITDGAFGGIGVFSRVYGPLATGINLSFVKEVDVKTGGFEPQYGKSTGGIVQIVTKSGGDAYHGEIGAFFGPQQFERVRLNPDNFGRVNQNGITTHQGEWDVDAEFGGPLLKNRLFFFGAFNPSYNAYYDQLATMHGVTGLPALPNSTLGQYSYDYSGKLTFKLTNNHVLETSIFGDPTRENNFGPNATLATLSTTSYDKLSNGTRNWVVRYNGTLSPTWLVNASWSWGHNYLTDTLKNPDVYSIADLTGRTGPTGSPLGPDGTPLTGQYQRQGLFGGFFENTTGDNYGLSFDTQKVWNRFGSHTFTLGYRYERNYYAGSSERPGPRFTITPFMSEGTVGDDSLAGLQDNGAFQLRLDPGFCDPVANPNGCAFTNVPGYGNVPVVLLQTRGTFSDPRFHTLGRYHAAYANDSWAIGRHITVNAGYRWEQQMMQGSPYVNPVTNVPTLVHYTFTDNWSPRFGLAIDPLGDRKTKIYGNFARYSYAIPLDLAIRSLSNEQDAYVTYWLPPTDNSLGTVGGNMLTNPDGTLAPLQFDDAHNLLGGFGALSNQSGEAIAQGTKMQYLQEFVGGIEHEFKHGLTVDLRFQDRRLRRIVEDMAGLSPEGSDAGVAQVYEIGNPSQTTDLFTNEQSIIYPDVTDPNARPAGCSGAPFIADSAIGNPPGATQPSPNANPILSFDGTDVGGVCVVNGNAGAPTPDGKPDGFVNPVRIYRAVELETNKSFSNGWQWRMNYRWSELLGNYEGAFRNDNGQSDPSISSLFDFTPGKFNLLGDQFAVGNLNTDRRHTFNNFVSYTFGRYFLKNLTVGAAARIQSGDPINDLRAHPVYQNAGEIPVGGRGALGRTATYGQGDVHADYTWKVTERDSLHLIADFFNVTNQRTQLRVDQNQDRSFLIPNADFQKPTGSGNIGIPLGFQRPFYARLGARFVF